MPDSKKPTYSNFELLAHIGDPACKPQPQTAQEQETAEQAKKIKELYEIRRRYKWQWNAGARYLYAELIRAYGLDGEWQESLMKMAEPTPGRKHEVGTAVRIALLKRQGMTAKQIADQLCCEHKWITVRGVEAYLKRRRKPSGEEEAREAVQRAFSKRKQPDSDV